MADNPFVSQVNGPHLIVERLGEELVIFDRNTNKAHLLDPRAASIWWASAGGVAVDSLLPLVEGATDAKRRGLLLLAISDLERAGLVVGSGLPKEVSRRRLLKTLGAAAGAPLVISILAPRAEAVNTACITSSGGGENQTRALFGGMCGTTCTTPINPSYMCHSLSGVNVVADGCVCLANADCCSHNCNGTTMFCDP